MITVNGFNVKVSTFPDRTPCLRVLNTPDPVIVWKYKDMGEVFDLYCVRTKINELGLTAPKLKITYLPCARQDKSIDPYECVTVKTLNKMINRLDFKSVEVLDPHSATSMMIRDGKAVLPTEYIKWAIKESGAEVLFFPDIGAKNRYASIVDELGLPYTYGRKTRDYAARTVTAVEIDEPDKIKGKKVLIVDDICSKGSTFTKASNSLFTSGAADVALYVTHCEPKILAGEVLDIMDVYATDSLSELWDGDMLRGMDRHQVDYTLNMKEVEL